MCWETSWKKDTVKHTIKHSQRQTQQQQAHICACRIGAKILVHVGSSQIRFEILTTTSRQGMMNLVFSGMSRFRATLFAVVVLLVIFDLVKCLFFCLCRWLLWFHRVFEDERFSVLGLHRQQHLRHKRLYWTRDQHLR